MIFSNKKRLLLQAGWDKLHYFIIKKINSALVSLKIIRSNLNITNIIINTINRTLDGVTEGIIYCLWSCAGIFLFGSIFYLLCEFVSWEETGRWVTRTYYNSFNGTDGKAMSLFSIPGHLGIQNILNKILFSSLPITFFIISIVLAYIATMLEGREEKCRIFLILLLLLWVRW